MVWIASSEDESAAIKELATASGRSAAILGAAFLDDRLAIAIAEKFPVGGDTKREMFKSTGPLGNLDIRAKLAYTLGIISKLAFQDVARIAQVRNLFAHRISTSDFKGNEVATRCANLKLVVKFPRFRGHPNICVPGVRNG